MELRRRSTAAIAVAASLVLPASVAVAANGSDRAPAKRKAPADDCSTTTTLPAEAETVESLDLETATSTPSSDVADATTTTVPDDTTTTTTEPDDCSTTTTTTRPRTTTTTRPRTTTTTRPRTTTTTRPRTATTVDPGDRPPSTSSPPPTTASPTTAPPTTPAPTPPTTDRPTATTTRPRTPPATRRPTTTTRPRTPSSRPPATATPTTRPRSTPTTAPPTTVASPSPTTTLPPDLGLPPEVDINGPSGSQGHTATRYDGIFAEGVPIGIAMATSRYLESGGDYTVQNRYASASGAYQVIDSTWNGYGGYERAYQAPPAVQDQFAYESFVAILKRYGNDVSKIPLAWYYPVAITRPELMDVVPMPDAGNVLTPREYQARWMGVFFDLLGEGAPPYLPSNDPSQPYIRQIAFPVVGPVSYINDWGFPRGESGERSHEGTDLIGTSMQPLRAATDGTVTRIRYTNEGTAGVAISVTDTAGYRYNYFHVNDDRPGTTDGAAPPGLRIHPELRVGSQVQAGQVIAYMGDSGNAVGIPHLHFEIRTLAGDPVNPYPSLLAAQQREQCSVGIGPWSTAYRRPDPGAVDEASPVGSAGSRSYDVVGPDGASWEVTDDGEVRATGVGAMIAAPAGDDCPELPRGTYGTNAKGLSPGLLPASWWDLAGSDRVRVPPDQARSSQRPNLI